MPSRLAPLYSDDGRWQGITDWRGPGEPAALHAPNLWSPTVGWFNVWCSACDWRHEHVREAFAVALLGHHCELDPTEARRLVAAAKAWRAQQGAVLPAAGSPALLPRWVSARDRRRAS